jgi:hypothetical protein
VASADFQTGLAEAVQEHIRKAVIEDSEAVIQKAVKEFEVGLRDRIGQVATRLFSVYDMEQQRNALIIRVENAYRPKDP